VFIAGATSAIAEAAARLLARDGADLLLAARHAIKLEAVAADLRVRGAARVQTLLFEAEDLAGQVGLWNAAVRMLGEVDALLIAHGNLPDQARAEEEPLVAARSLQVNLSSPAVLVLLAGAYFEQRGQGWIGVVTSVAGDRGRRSNYVYGAAKGGLTILLDGLRARLAGAGVAVVNFKPGFVDTPMTAHLPKNPLYTSAETVGRAIHRALRHPRPVVYVPWFWRWVMLVVRVIPGPIFRKLRL